MGDVSVTGMNGATGAGNIAPPGDGAPARPAGASALHIFKILIIVILAGFAIGSVAQIAGTARAQPAASPASQTEPSGKAIESWQEAIARRPPSRKGCFRAAFPDTTWREVKCATATGPTLSSAPIRRGGAAGGGGLANSGNGNDWVAQVNSGQISSATGSFDQATGVIDEQDGGMPNSFGLQLNTNVFNSPTCAGAPNPACQGWEQFIFQNSSAPDQHLDIQYWLLNYNKDGKTCPTNLGFTPGGGLDCAAVPELQSPPPTQPVTVLSQLKLTGTSRNGLDTVMLTLPGGSATAFNTASVLGLGGANLWKQTEFNVVGWCCYQQANFNSGVTLAVRAQVNNNTGNAPSCVNNGSTGETVNLNLGSCSTVGGSAPAIKFTESNPPGSIWQYTGTPCNSANCKGWKELDDNNDSVRIASTGGNVYQLHNSGTVWNSTGAACNGGSCPGWNVTDSSDNTLEIVAGGNVLYQLDAQGQVFRFTGGTGSPLPGWQMLDNNTSIATIAAATGGLYEIHSTGNIWKWSGTPCNGSVCSGSQQLDNNTETVAIVAESNNLYQLHNTGSVWKYTGTPCSGGVCNGWTMLNNNTNALQIAASGGNLYELDVNGVIWKFNGTPCKGSNCTAGWQMLDNNPAAMTIAADSSNLYELHDTGNLWRWLGTPCSGNSCPGWQQIDNNPWTGRIAASNGQLYELHVIQTPPSRSLGGFLQCYDCR